MATTWVKVPAEFARTHPYAKLRGWATLMVIGLFLAFLFVWYPLVVVNNLLDSGKNRNLDLLFQLQTTATVLGLGATILTIISIATLSKRKPTFAGWYTATQVFIVVLSAAIVLQSNGDIAAMLTTLIGVVIWVAYVHNSRRIRVYTRNEVKSNDTWLEDNRHKWESAGAVISTGASVALAPAPLAQEVSRESAHREPSQSTATHDADLRIAFHRVVLEGRTLGDKDLDAVAASLAELFERPVGSLRSFLDGRAHVIKRGQSKSEAARYQAALERVGAATRVELDL